MKWVTKYWANIGGVIAVVIVFSVFYAGSKFKEMNTLLWLHFAMLLMHQFEEYVYPGGFKEFFQGNIYNKNWILRFPLNDQGIVLVNVVLGWTAYLVSAVKGEKMIWLAIGLLGVTVLNGLMHTLMFVIRRKYNPGFITGIIFFIPFGTYLLLQLVPEVSTYDLVSGILVFVFGTLLIPLSIYITNVLDIFKIVET
jgi:hypothetical protein